MIEFLSDYIHELNDLDNKNFEPLYIKELEVKINEDFLSAKKGKSSIVEIKNKISAEKIHMMSLFHLIDEEIRDYVEDWNNNLEWPAYEHIPEKDIVRESVLGTERHLHLEEIGVTTHKKITFEEVKEKHVIVPPTLNLPF